MALNIGELVAYISVDASRAETALSDFQGRMRRAGDSASDRFQNVGQTISGVGGDISGVGRDLTLLTGPATGAALAVGGITAALGWGRLTSIDSAQAQLRGLGYEAGDVERISGQVSTALEGGMMTLGEGTKVAAGALAAGVQEGAELERYIGLVDAAAVGMNATTDETALIFNRIQGSGKVMRTELDMVEQRMPGFSNALQEHVGAASQEEFQKMVSNGEVGADDFMTVMEGFAGGMAEEYSKSFEGMVANTKAYVGMIGQALLGGVFEQSKDALADFVSWISDPAVQAKAGEIGETIGSAFTKIIGVVQSVASWFLNLDSGWQKLILGAAGVVAAIGPFLLILGNIITTIGGAITAIGTIIGLISKLSVVFGVIGKVVGIATTAFRALSLAMMANPAGLIIAAITALVAALVWFFTQTELGRQIIDQFVDGVIIAWNWLKETSVAVFDAVVSAVVGAWEWIRDKTTEIWEAVTGWITENWSTIVDFLALLNPVTAVIRHWDKIKEATSAAWGWVKDKTSALWQGIVDAVSNAAAAVVTWVTNSWDKAKSLTSAAWQAVLSTITGIASRLQAAVANMGQRVVTAVLNAWNRVKSSTSSAWQAVVNTITGIANRIWSAIVNMGSRAVSAVLNAWNNARNTTVSAWNGIRTAVSNGINGVVSFVRGLPGKVLSALGNLGSLLVGSGRSLIDGFTRGIRNAFTSAVNAVKSGVQRVRNFFPFSPAKEGPFSGHGYTSYSGQKMIEDFAGGMESAESDVVRQAEAITRAAAFDIPDVPGLTKPEGHDRAATDRAPAGGVTNNFTIVNPVAEPTSETARKASAYIGVTV